LQNGTAGTTDLRQQQLLSASALFAQGSSGGSYQSLGTHSHPFQLMVQASKILE